MPASIVPMGKDQKLKVYFREWREYVGNQRGKKMTQEEAAERMGFTQETVSRLERGDQAFTPESLEAASNAYGCDAGELFYPPGRSKSQLEKTIETLSDHQQARAIRIIKAMSEDDAA